MDLGQVLRLIVVFWPMIERILAAIEDEGKRNEVKKDAEKTVASLMADALKGVQA